MFECPTCGALMEGSCKYRGGRKHVKKCEAATPAQRKYYKRTGHWPKKGRTLAGDRIKVSV